MNKIKVAIIGASGYTGVELVRILLNHQNVEISVLGANSNASQAMSDLYPHLVNYDLPILSAINEIDFSALDAVFCCLPHTTSQEIIGRIMEDKNNSHLKIFDLSADFRLQNIDDYKKWYGHDHVAPSLQPQAVYGLSEIYRAQIKKANLIACPGCYPTSALLPLIPLLENNLIKKENIVIDSKSGATGAGRSLKIGNLFCEVNNSVKAYSIGNHRHIGEIEQELARACKSRVYANFTPHLIPINRGIISTIYVDLNDGFSLRDAKNCLQTKYDDEYFVRVIDGEPNISDVVATNFCVISAKQSRDPKKIVIVSVIDNLCKGASGQAVQNFNIAFGLDEKSALQFVPLTP